MSGFETAMPPSRAEYSSRSISCWPRLNSPIDLPIDRARSGSLEAPNSRIMATNISNISCEPNIPMIIILPFLVSCPGPPVPSLAPDAVGKLPVTILYYVYYIYMPLILVFLRISTLSAPGQRNGPRKRTASLMHLRSRLPLPPAGRPGPGGYRPGRPGSWLPGGAGFPGPVAQKNGSLIFDLRLNDE